MEQTKPRKILPPDVDENVTFGIMWIRIGKLKLNRGKILGENQIIIQFWGQKQPTLLQTTSNPLNKVQNNTLIQYDIKCPITYFKDYLLDMKKNLRFQVENAGRVDFDITKFFKPNVDLTSRHLFDHLKGSFEILGKNSRKIGSLQIQMACNFNPQIAAFQLNKSDNQQLQQSASPIYQQTSQKSAKKNIQKKQFIDFEDNRIPNSLNIQTPNQKFDPFKYLNEGISAQQSSKIQKNQQQSSKQKFKSNSRQQQPQQQMIQERDADDRQNQPISSFPTIAKVLTYSNLRLAQQLKSDEKPFKQTDNNQFFEQLQVQERKQTTKRSQILNALETPYQNIQKQFYEEHMPQIKQSFLNDSTNKNNKNKVLNNAQSQQIKISPKKSVQKYEQYEGNKNESNLLEQQKEILSRVVNLDQELKKSVINSPVKQIRSEKQLEDIKNQEFTKYQNKEKEFISIQNKMVTTYTDVRPVTQFKTSMPILENNKNNQNFKKPHFTQMNFATIKTKPSSLILNLIVQIQTISIKIFNKKEKYHIIHRPYGCKERIKLGPKFQSDKIIIICPVTEELVRKMDKLPFIIQFWGAVTNQFLGFIKINLTKIKKGFFLNDRLNEIAIKSSLMPIIIQNGQTHIQNVNGQKSGSCSIYAAVGTFSQTQLYFNSNRKSPIVVNNQNQIVPQKQKKTKQHLSHKKQQNQYKLNFTDCHIVLTNFLQYVDKNSNKIINHLTQFMKKKQLTCQQFQQFIVSINQNQEKVKQLSYLFRFFDVSKFNNPGNFIETKSFKNSFDQFKRVQQRIKKEYFEVSGLITKRINQRMKQQILSASSFSVIQKKKLKQIYLAQLLTQSNLSLDTKYQKQMFETFFLSFFDEYVNLQVVLSNQLSKHSYQPSFKLVIKYVLRNFIQEIIKNCQSLQIMSEFFKEQPKQQEFYKKLWKYCTQNISLISSDVSVWYMICLLTGNLQKSEKEQQQFMQNLEQAYKDLNIFSQLKQKMTAQIQKSKQKAVLKPSKQNIIKKVKAPQIVNSQQNNSINQSDLNQLLNNQNESNFAKILNQDQSIAVNIQKRIIDSNILIQKQNINISNSQLSENKQISKQQKQVQCIQHSFSIKGLQLYIQIPFEGQCIINYLFPYEQEAIGSKKIKIFKNKHKYNINLYGQHTISLDSDIQSYLNEIPIKFELINLKHQQNYQIIMQGDLHPDQIILEANSTQSKVVPLFEQNHQKVKGKIKIQIQYKTKTTEKATLGKQTVYNIFLPKNGFVNFNLQVKLQEQKIKSQYNFENQQFYVSIVLDFFNQNKNLKIHYPCLASKLYSDLNEQVQFRNAIKTSLNPVILDYLKQKHCLISLNLVYYSKQKASYQKKEITFATLKVPLFNLIKQNGIQGNYAFKNKYGMFVGLCKVQMKYDKYEKKQQVFSQTQLSSFQNKKSTKEIHYWIVIHFKELINFDQNLDTKSIKFETIFGGTKFQTQKIHLSDDNLLIFNDLIALKMTEQQFFSTKILPISIYFDHNQKYAMDINLRIISKRLSSHKYFSNGGYFLVVDQQSQLRKIRVGARISVFKGSSMIQPFVSACCSNLNTDVLSQLQLSRDLQNYPKQLQIFRNSLKLSKRAFQDSLKHLLSLATQKLSIQLMSSQLLYRLDLSPIIAQSSDEVDSLTRSIDGAISQTALFEYIEENNIVMKNLHQQTVNLYSFDKLWHDKIDKNVEYFNLGNEIDILTLARKVRVVDGQDLQDCGQDFSKKKYKELRITLEKGINFHYLYNGIKPNVMVKIPLLSYESRTKHRTSQPVFNQTLRQIVEKQNQHLFRNLEFEVYHIANTQNQQEEILIGSGSLNVVSCTNLSNPKQKGQEKEAKVIISSAMSSKMKATLQIKLKLSILGDKQQQSFIKKGEHNVEDASMIEDMIKDINKEMDTKKHLFDQSSSDQEY